MDDIGRRTIGMKGESVVINGILKTKITVTCPYCGQTFIACFRDTWSSTQKALDDYDHHSKTECEEIEVL